ncbi:MAG: aldo/keto reductase, partial [Verrucomicrobiota bacterium]|nr:aldo/keto reductase [Verrucomicrobiota bacterium]
ADETRYDKMPFRACGRSGLQLPILSLGAWETFGGYVGPEQARGCIFRAFNLGITHFDLANNYGTPVGRSEIIVGRTLREMPRGELIVSTKAGFPMWPGPYGQGGSRKALLGSIDQSLTRLGLDHVDIFYSHRPDPATPLEETLRALDQIVRSGKALYVGLSNYPTATFEEAARLACELGLAPLVAAQSRYNMLRREMEFDLFARARDLGLGVIAFSPLAQGMLSAKYLEEIPENSRVSRRWSAEQRESITPALREQIRRLQEVAQARGQTLAQMAIAWTLRRPEVTTALIGASEIEQIEENVKALEQLSFSDEELQRIDAILAFS